MVPNADLWIIRISTLLLIIYLSFAPLFGQSIKKDTLHVSNDIIAFSQDRSNNIFLAFAGGDITKYSPNFDSLLSYSPTKVGDVTLLEAWHGFQIFTFYDQFQEYTLFNRYLTQDTHYSLVQTPVDYVDMCTISSDQNLWVFEENSLRLLKINTTIKEVTLEVPLEFIISNQEHHITFLKEYQNLLFIVDALSGVYIFDNLGNYLRKIEVTGVTKCDFRKDQLIYLVDNKIQLLNLYQQGPVQEIKIPPGKYLGLLPLEHSLILVEKNQLVRLALPMAD